MQPYAMDSVSLGSAEEPHDSDMNQSYRLTEGRMSLVALIGLEYHIVLNIDISST